jgi:hypothetical protein
MSVPRQILEQQYKAAAAEGAIYELHMRLLADKVPELQQAAYGERLEDIENFIVSHFKIKLSCSDMETFQLSRQLRNKILHCDFLAVRNKLRALGADPQRADVKKIDIAGMSGVEMAAKIAAVASNTPGTFEYVADNKPAPGAVFGWLLEVGAAGDFQRAVDCFARATEIVDRLAMSS